MDLLLEWEVEDDGTEAVIELGRRNRLEAEFVRENCYKAHVSLGYERHNSYQPTLTEAMKWCERKIGTLLLQRVVEIMERDN